MNAGETTFRLFTSNRSTRDFVQLTWEIAVFSSFYICVDETGNAENEARES